MPTEDELYRAYRNLMNSTTIRVNNKIDIALRNFTKEIKTSTEKFSVLYDEFVDSAALDESIAVTLRSSIIQQTAIGYATIPTISVNKIEAIATPEKLVEIFGKTKGSKISSNIYRSIEDTQKQIVSTLQKAHSDRLIFNKTVARMEKQLDKVTAKQEQLSKYMRDIEKAGKRVIVVDDEVGRRELKNAVKKAQTNINNLTDNKPFKKAQQSALNKAVSAIQSNSLDRLNLAIEKGVSNKYKSNMRKLVVTENGNAYEQAMYNERRDNPYVFAVKFTLSSSHKIVDQCNILASADLYGFGAGVYPLKEQPQLTIHPNGVSYMQSVPINKVSEAQANSAGSLNNSKLAKLGKEAKLSPSQIKALEQQQTQPKTQINSKLAIESVT